MWESMAHDECQFCAIVSKNVRTIHDAGGHMLMDSPEWVGKAQVKKMVTMDRWHVTLRAKVSASVEYDSSGNVVEDHEAGRNAVTFAMHHDGDMWRAVDIRITNDG